MKATATEKVWTDDELMALDCDGRGHELWFGKVVMAKLFEDSWFD